MQRTSKQIDWRPTDSGWRCGRYEVVLEGPGRWVLEVDGRRTSTHRRASDAATGAQVAERTRRRRRSVRRNLVAIVVAAVALLAAQAGRNVPNDAYDPAREFVVHLEEAYRAVESGSVSVDSFVGRDGIIGGSFLADLPFDLGDGARVEPRAYAALVGVHDVECYVIRWIPGGAAFSGVLASDLPCEPAPRLIQPGLFVRAASQSPNAASFDWERVLPPRAFQARWFVPVLLATLYTMLHAAIGVSLALIRPAGRWVPPLPVVPGRTPTPRP